MGCKVGGTILNINNTFGPGTANEWPGTANEPLQQWFQKFWKGEESTEDEECSGWPPEVDNDQFRAISKLILLNYMRSCWRTQRRPFYSHQHLKQTGKVKNLDKGVSHVMSRPHQKKKLSFWSVVFF